MCGIFLYYNQEETKHTIFDTYQKMSAALSHRGPDAMGVTAIPMPSRAFIESTMISEKTKKNEKFCSVGNDFFNHGTYGFIGHHRLAIIDLDIASSQPFLDPSASFALSYNGMLYNYLELRRELVQLGFHFRTNSDTEVVLNAYLAWDTDCFQKFNGDFALLIYDHRKKTIIGARDRLGVKPLFYHKNNQAITFASELKGFLSLPGFSPALNEKVAYQYLVAEFPTSDTLKSSFLKDVSSVLPGHWFEVDLDSRSIAFKRYWNIEEDSFDTQLIPDFNDAVKSFDDHLKNAVQIRLRSDVMVGSLLSGGMDSPSMVWHAIQDGNKIPTYSSVFPGSPMDESKNIKSLEICFDIRNYQQQVDFEDFYKDINSLVWLQDEPFSTLNVYTQFKNAQHAKNQGAKVLLDGGGADEYLAGYTDYRLLAAADSGDASYLTLPEKNRLNLFLNLSSSDLCDYYNIHERESRTVDYINPDFRTACRDDSLMIDRPLDPNFKSQFMGSFLKNSLFNSTVGSWMNKSIAWDNRYLDRTCMYLGIEGRVPFQDHRLVEHIFSLPHDYIYRDGFSKYILRKSMENRLPGAITGDRKKIGFPFPFCEFIANNKKFRNIFYDLAAEDNFKDNYIVDKQKVVAELDNIKSGQSHNYNLWRVFNLYLWYGLFIT